MCLSLQETVEGPRWHNQDSPYTCSVASPKKESKMKGLKSYIAYQLTPTVSFRHVHLVLLILGTLINANGMLMEIAGKVQTENLLVLLFSVYKRRKQ